MFCTFRQALSAYPTTIDEDLALLQKENVILPGSPARMAILVRQFVRC